jgi:indolepyruvate ferredoxin oxidoreductase
MLTAFRLLAPLKTLRGTALDVFGRTEERRMERQLIADYRQTLEQVLGTLNSGNHTLAVELARLPETIKGFGHVKARNVQAARTRWQALLAQWNNG